MSQKSLKKDVMIVYLFTIFYTASKSFKKFLYMLTYELREKSIICDDIKDLMFEDFMCDTLYLRSKIIRNQEMKHKRVGPIFLLSFTRRTNILKSVTPLSHEVGLCRWDMNEVRPRTCSRWRVRLHRGPSTTYALKHFYVVS